MMYKLSIIIPVYNAQDYLSRPIESVIKQTIGFENIELILVDDNSTDNTREVINKYCDEYDNVIPIFLDENHGSAGAGRNIGIRKATADYVMFLDNDDELNDEVCEKLYGLAILENADVISCDSIIRDGEKEIRTLSGFYSELDETKPYIVLTDDDANTFDTIVIHGKLFKRTLLLDNNIYFPEKMTCEDFMFSRKAFLYCDKLVYTHYFGYYWYMLSSSLSHRIDETYFNNAIKAAYIILDLLKKENKTEFIPIVFKFTIRDTMMQFYRIKASNKQLKSLMKKLYEFEKEINFAVTPDEKWEKIINTLIIRKKFTLAIIVVRTVKKLGSSELLAKIYRRVIH